MKKVIGFILTAIICLGLGVGCTYFYMNNMKEESKNEENKAAGEVNSNKVEYLDVYNEETMKAFNMFMSAYWSCADNLIQFLKNSKLEAKDISNDYAYALAARDFYNDKNDITKDAIEKKVKEYLGEDYKFEHKEYLLCTTHTYDKTTDSYKYIPPACGCTSGPNSHTIYGIDKVYKNDNKITYEMKILFPYHGQDYINANGYHKYYKDAGYTKEITDLEYTGDYYTGKENYYPFDDIKNISKGGKYKLVFEENESGTYKFLYSEPLND